MDQLNLFINGIIRFEENEWTVELELSQTKIKLQESILLNHEYDVPQWIYHKATGKVSRWIEDMN